MPSPASSPPTITRDSIIHAVDALLKWMVSEASHGKAQLLDHDDLIHLVLTLSRIPSTNRINPYRILIPHPLHSLDHTTSICLILDDRSHTSFKPLSQSVPFAKLIALSDLRSDYRPFEARRRLCDSYDLFFADRKIIPLLPRLLGKHFFKSKKIPLAIDFSRKGWIEQIRQCCNSTLLYLRTGTCSGIKVGRVSQDRDHIVDNIMAAINGAVDLVPRKWANVRSLHIKSMDSVALPIYQALPELGFKIEVLKKEEAAAAVQGEVIQTEKSSQDSLKKKNKRGRIHEVCFTNMAPEFNIEDDVGDAVEDEGGEEKDKLDAKVKKPKGKKKLNKDSANFNADDKVVAKDDEETNELDVEEEKPRKKKKKQKQNVDIESPKEKGSKRKRDDSVVIEDIGQIHLGDSKKASHESGVDKRTRKEKAGKDQKIKRNQRINV